MKTFILFLLLISCSSNKMQTKKKIIFFGDSITELAVKPDGFITKLQQKLNDNKEGSKYDLIGTGISGNKVYDLYLRLDDDVLAKKPDAVVIWIGVNDVWHKKILGTGTDADKFEVFYTAIIKKLKEKNIAIYLCTPAVIGEKWDYTNELDGDLNKYANIIRNLAQKNKCVLIDLRQNFLDYLKINNTANQEKGILTTDGVHLSNTGNAFVADKLYEVLDTSFFKQ